MTSVLARLRPSGPPPATGFDRRLLAPMILGALLNPVNSSMIAVALVPIGIALGAPPSGTAWLVSGLYLATAVGQPVVGRLIDLFGPRRLFLAGSTLVGLGGLIGALAPSIGVLVASRVLLGLGTCAGYPAAMTLLRSEGQRTGRDSPSSVLTTLAVATQTVAAIGPTLGGLLIGVGGWRATFTVNVPLAATSLVLGALYLPRDAPVDAERRRGLAATVDLGGIVAFTVTLIALLLVLMHPADTAAYLLPVAVVAASALVWWELRARSPFLDLRLLGGNRPLLATYARALLTAITSYALLYGYTQWLEDGRGLAPSVAGLLLLPVFVTGVVVTATTGRRPQIRGKLVVGAAAQVVLAVLLLLLGPASPIWLIVVVALVAGVPQGLNNLANQNAVYHQADAARVGSSAGLLRTFFYLGAIVASTANGVFLSPRADAAGLHDLALFVLGASVLFLVITVADRSLAHVGAAGRDQPRPAAAARPASSRATGIRNGEHDT